MDIQNKQIWQQASGDTNRDFSELCLKRDVILYGPGYAGEWPECQELLQADGWRGRKMADLRRFCEEMQIGDLVVLRRGTISRFAVGEFAGGWDLQHCRRVRWLWIPNGEPMSFDTDVFILGDTTYPLDSPEVETWLSTLVVPDHLLN